MHYDMENVWQLLYPEHIVNVLMIHRIKLQGEQEDASITRDGLMHYDTISSSQLFKYHFGDQLYYEKFKTTEIPEIFASFKGDNGSTITPKVIFIEGAPGMGKTTLCKEITYLWAHQKLLQGIKMIFLLFLRDPAIQHLHELRDLIHYFYKFNEKYLVLSYHCAEILAKRDNSDIAILMDGYDELSDKNNKLIKDIIERKILLGCKIVITSRAITSEKLQVADVRVEVLGFTEQSRIDYVKKKFKDDPKKITDLLAYLDRHSDIKQVCYVPIIMTILACTFKEYEELPTNQSELFENFVTLIISRFLQKVVDPELPTVILSLDKLPDKYKEYLQQLSEFAFKTIENDKIIFSNVDIEQLSPNLALSTKELQGLGLFKATEHFNFRKIDNCVWYNFLHLSLHEFLAAYYLKSLNTSEQFQILQKTFFEKHYISVWLMFFGLQRNLTFEFHQFFTYGCMHWVSDATKDEMKAIIEKLYPLNFNEIKNMNIKDIKGTMQLLCCKNNQDDLQTDVTKQNFIEGFESWCLFFFTVKSKWTKLFASLCSVDNDDRLIDVYLLDKNTKDISYYQIVRELRQNQNISVVLVSSGALIGYRSNCRQLTDGLNMNASLECIILRNCLINVHFAEILSSCFINSHYLKYLCITDCSCDQPALQLVFQALMKTSKIKVLDLHGNNMTEQVVEDLANVIKKNSNLEELCLSCNNFKASVITILQALKENSKLYKLHLNNNNMTRQVANHLADVIKTNSNLQQLGLGDNALGPSTIVILQALVQNSKLKLLNLKSNYITGQVVEQLANVIKNNSNLNYLGLANNGLGPSANVILKTLKKISKLRILNLQHNDMTCEVAEDLANVIKNNSGIEELRLSYNRFKSSASVILQALKENSKLRILQLSSNSMAGQVAEDLASVIKTNSNLEQLGLGNNKLGSSAVVILQALTQNCRLKLLNLNNTNLTGEIAEYLARVIKNNSNLTYLGLANNLLGISTAVILQALKENSKLEVLYLCNNNMTGQVAEDLAKVIKNNSGLKEIYLSHNCLRSSAVLILQALKENSKLKILDLGNNNMTGVIAEELANVIKNNPSLEEIFLSHNDLKSSGVVIIQALIRNSKLKVLNLNGNNMTGQVAKDLAHAIKNNSGLAKLYLSANDLKISMAVVLQAVNATSKLKILDLNNNNMTGQTAEDLANVIKNNSNLERLGLRNNKLGYSAAIIFRALIRNHKLKLLNLSGNNMTGKVAKELASVIKSNLGLQELYLSDNDLKSSAVIILQAINFIKQLRILSLTNNHMSNSSVIDILSVIKNNPFITELWLGDNLLQSGLIDIARDCNNLRNLRVLEFSHNSINPTEVVQLTSVITKFSSLQALLIDGLVLNVKERICCSVFQSYDSTSKQTRVLQSNNNFDINETLDIVCSEMWRLHFAERIKLCYVVKNYFYTDLIPIQVIHLYNLRDILSTARQSEQKLLKLDATNMIVSLINIIKTLKVLDLGYSNIKLVAAVKLAHALKYNSVLEQLWLRGNILDDEGAALILNSLQNISTLKVLDLSYNNISSTLANGIAAVITSNHFLEQLWLDGNMLMTTGVVIIASILKERSNLKLLSLSNNRITEDAAEEISDIVNSNFLLGGLLLSNNQLGSIGVDIIAKSLNGITYLRILELTNTCIDATAGDKLAAALSNCACLKQLYLGRNNLGTTGAIKICQVLNNTAVLLQVLSLTNNNISEEAANEICNVIITNNSLAILLLGGNDLQTTGVMQIADVVKNNNPTMQLLSLNDNNVDELIKKEIKARLCDQYDLVLFI